MRLPEQPVTLTVDELKGLSEKLSTMRHDINNHLALIVAAVELMRHKPEAAQRMMTTLSEQPSKIEASVRKFSAEFEKAVGIKRP